RTAVFPRDAADTTSLKHLRPSSPGAASPLTVAAATSCHGFVRGEPDGARSDRHGRLRSLLFFAAFAYERLVERDGVHLPSPNQEGIGGTGRSLIAMAAALHDQAKLVFSGEVDRGDDILGLLGGHRIDARQGCPGTDPT